jgi:magnesium chelatase subunit D
MSAVAAARNMDGRGPDSRNPDEQGDAGAPAGAPWPDALMAAALFAIDPRGIGGVRLRAAAGPLRDAWFGYLGQFLGAATPVLRVPCHVDEARLLGGLDLAATLRAGRPVAEQGLLALGDQGVLALQMAERLRPGSAALIASVLDEGQLRVERDGFSLRTSARIAVVACDEGLEADEPPAAGLMDRLGLWLDLGSITWRDAALGVDFAPDPGAPLPALGVSAADLAAARSRLGGVVVPPALCEALCATCVALGIDSLRIPLLALRVTRAAAALDGAPQAGQEHAAIAARLVIAPRARTLPAPAAGPEAAPDQAPDEVPDTPPENASAPPDAEPEQAPDDDRDDADEAAGALAEAVLEAARAVLPADLLENLSSGIALRAAGAGAVAGRTGVKLRSKRRGRPVGTRRGELRDGARLHVLETLRTAAPWQAIRGRSPRMHRAAAGSGAGTGNAQADAAVAARRIEVRREDFRIVRYSQRLQTTVIFVVDASGSAALNRLAEAKGAVELFLADCYVRRDQVALIAFRGRSAELVLSPTRSLARARRCLAAVPGGGGTPVAAGLRSAASVAEAVRRRGDVPLLVVLTDGKANVALDGSGGRERAGSDALAMARVLRGTRIRALLVDFSQRAQPDAERLAAEIGARYLPLPRADATLLADAVRRARLETA